MTGHYMSHSSLPNFAAGLSLSLSRVARLHFKGTINHWVFSVGSGWINGWVSDGCGLGLGSPRKDLKKCAAFGSIR